MGNGAIPVRAVIFNLFYPVGLALVFLFTGTHASAELYLFAMNGHGGDGGPAFVANVVRGSVCYAGSDVVSNPRCHWLKCSADFSINYTNGTSKSVVCAAIIAPKYGYKVGDVVKFGPEDVLCSYPQTQSIDGQVVSIDRTGPPKCTKLGH